MARSSTSACIYAAASLCVFTNQPHAHNLDGFFVCKLKVDVVPKGPPVATDEAPEEVVFDDAEDEKIIQRSRDRQSKKRRVAS